MTSLTTASNQVWLEYYDEIAEEIDDDILDQVDAMYTVDLLVAVDITLPDAYYITAAQLYKARQSTPHTHTNTH